MEKCSFFFNQHFLLSLLLLHCCFLFSSSSDLEALLNFKSAADSTGKLNSWNSTTDPCKWTGVSCAGNRVTRLVLENLDLTGSIEPLASLTELRVLSLKRNRLSGPIPDLSKLTALKLLFLSENQFSGEFPASVTSLSRLYRLDLSSNNFPGEIPPALNHLTCIVVDIIPPENSQEPLPSPPKKHNNFFRSLLFRKKSNKLSSVSIVEELFEEGSAMLAERLGSGDCSKESTTGGGGIFTCAICQLDLAPSEGISVHAGSIFSTSLKPWQGPFLCTDCRDKKDAMEGKRPSGVKVI